MKQRNSRHSHRVDPLYKGYEHVANATKMLRSSDASAFYELEKHGTTLPGALRTVTLPRVSRADEERKLADERLALLQQK